MSSDVELAECLKRVSTRRMRRRLVRCVPALDFLESSPPSFLYTSGRPNRCNPPGVDCLYFSETERVATLEYRGVFAGTSAANDPKLTFVAEVDLRHVVDLGKANVRSVLGLSAADLSEPWRGAAAPTRLQSLGLAITRQRHVSAIRYPSEACRRAGTGGSRDLDTAAGTLDREFRRPVRHPPRHSLEGEDAGPPPRMVALCHGPSVFPRRFSESAAPARPWGS